MADRDLDQLPEATSIDPTNVGHIRQGSVDKKFLFSSLIALLPAGPTGPAGPEGPEGPQGPPGESAITAPEWDVTTRYSQNEIVSSDGYIFISSVPGTGTNTGNAPGGPEWGGPYHTVWEILTYILNTKADAV